MTLRNAIFIFLGGFLLNIVWENIHSFLYIHYQDGYITEYILLRAALVDALIIFCGIFLSQSVATVYRIQFLTTFWLMIALTIEWWALSSNRWSYTAAMPIVPFLNVGLTPMIQLVIIGLFIDFFFVRKSRHEGI